MTSLLIHNYKLPPKAEKKFSENHDLRPSFEELSKDDFDFDFYYNKELKKLFKDKVFDIVYISLSLSDYDYLEMNGLRVAHHIRLTPDWKHQYIPIVILSQESELQIMKLNKLGSILLTKGVFLSNDLIVDQILEKENILEKDLAIYLLRIQIEPSANYNSSHSIANEWCILQWAKFLGINDKQEFHIVKQNIEGSLYFKYLKLKFPSKEFEEGDFNINGKGNILYIDDEWSKGWDIIFENLFLDSDIKFDVYDYKFKGKKRDDIIEACKNEIQNREPDIVLLDLRLADDDINDNDPTKLTGYKILQLIKGYYENDEYVEGLNPGIQVIIFTASNKVWNLTALLESGADGYSLKGSPEINYSESFTNYSLEELKLQVEKCLEYSFLKTFFSTLSETKKELEPRKKENFNHQLPVDFVDEYLKWLLWGNENLRKNKNELGLTTSFILYFSVLENISNRVIDIDNPIKDIIDPNNNQLYYFEFRIDRIKKLNVFDNKGTRHKCSYVKTTKTCFPKNIPWNQKILNSLDFLNTFNANQSIVDSLLQKRHDIIHANAIEGAKINVNKKDVKDLFNLITMNIKNIR